MALNNNLFANQARIYREVDRTGETWLKRQSRWTMAVTLLIFVALTAASLFGGSRGEISVTLDRELFMVGVYGDAEAVRYDGVRRITLLKEPPIPLRESEDGKLLVYREEGTPPRRIYCYPGTNSWLLVETDRQWILFNCETAEKTETLYLQITEKTG